MIDYDKSSYPTSMGRLLAIICLDLLYAAEIQGLLKNDYRNYSNAFVIHQSMNVKDHRTGSIGLSGVKEMTFYRVRMWAEGMVSPPILDQKEIIRAFLMLKDLHDRCKQVFLGTEALIDELCSKL